MRLIVPILLNCILVLGVYLADKLPPVKKLPYMAKQIIIGILFGGVSAFASSYGVEWLGAVVNVPLPRVTLSRSLQSANAFAPRLVTEEMSISLSAGAW